MARRRPYAVDATRETREFGAFLANSMVSSTFFEASAIRQFSFYASERRGSERKVDSPMAATRLERDASTLPGCS